MPRYDFQCENESCELETFDVLCKYSEIDEICCPECGSDNVSKLLSCPNLAFTKPHESSKWDSFSYRAGYNMNKAKDERRSAEAKSHVGSTPYQDAERVDLDKIDMAHEGHIV